MPVFFFDAIGRYGRQEFGGKPFFKGADTMSFRTVLLDERKRAIFLSAPPKT